MQRIVLTAAIIVGILDFSAIAFVFAFKVTRRIGQHHRRRVNAQMERVLGDVERAGAVGERVAALHQMRRPRLLQALAISKENFKPSTTELVVRVAKDRGIPGALGRVLLRGVHRKWTRVDAAFLLSDFGDAGEAVLAEAMKNPDVDIAFNSAQALGVMGTPESFAILLNYLPKLKQYSVSRIGHLLENAIPQGFPILIEAYTNESAVIRYWTAYLLGRSGKIEALPGLLELTADGDDNVKASATEALGALGQRDAAARLIQLLGDRAWFVRNHAVKSLQELGISYAAGRIAPLLQDGNWWVRENACVALVSFGSASLPSLIRMLDDDDRFARNKAAEALGRLGFIDQKIEQLKREPHNRQVLNLLKKIRREGSRGAIEKYAGDADEAFARNLREVLAA